MLRHWVTYGGLLACLCLMTGCETTRTAQGAGVGGLIGGGVGALAGAASGQPLAGAAIGAGAGGILGAAVGNDIDVKERRQREHALAVAQARADQAEARQALPQLGLTDVQRMSAQGIGDEVIINQIRTTGSVFSLSAADIEWLKTNGVSAGAIVEMQTSRPRPVAAGPRVINQPAPAVIVREPVPIYYVRPYYPPPPIGFHFGYVRVR